MLFLWLPSWQWHWTQNRTLVPFQYGTLRTGEQKVMLVVITLTGPLTSQIHVKSVCFDRKAATTQINVLLCYGSISRASLIFPLSTAHSLCGLHRKPLPSAQRGPFLPVNVCIIPWYSVLKRQDPGDKEWINGQKYNQDGNFMISLEGNIYCP